MAIVVFCQTPQGEGLKVDAQLTSKKTGRHEFNCSINTKSCIPHGESVAPDNHTIGTMLNLFIKHLFRPCSAHDFWKIKMYSDVSHSKLECNPAPLSATLNHELPRSKTGRSAIHQTVDGKHLAPEMCNPSE